MQQLSKTRKHDKENETEPTEQDNYDTLTPACF